MATGDVIALCTELCGGVCCRPWWAIIVYTLKKEGGLSGLSDFKKTIIKSVRERIDRVTTHYVTTEPTPRPLFTAPEKICLDVEDVTHGRGFLSIRLRAMFAFRCAFEGEEGVCLIHPAIKGVDIRPRWCRELGTPGRKAGEEGFCRIVDAAVSSNMDVDRIKKAVELERKVNDSHFNRGFRSVEEAAEAIIPQIRKMARERLPQLTPQRAEKKPGRNEPCFCGSGKKYKKCHGRF